MECLALFNEVYTVAFRLTGQEASSSDLALAALTMTAKECGWTLQKPIPPEMLPVCIKEVYRLFLDQPWLGKDSTPSSRTPPVSKRDEVLQAALLTLEPLGRATVVWRYVTGFKVAELVPVAGKAERNLYRYLSRALHDLSHRIQSTG